MFMKLLNGSFPPMLAEKKILNLINTFIDNSRYALTWEQIDL